MPGINLKRQPAYKPVSAGIINAIIDAVERLSRMRVGRGLVQTTVAGIPLLRADAGFTNVRWVLTPTAGIQYATSTTAGTVVTNTPGSALCFESSLNSTTGAWSTDTAITAALKVYNDWTSATNHTFAGVGQQWILVGTAADGSVRCMGDPCP